LWIAKVTGGSELLGHLAFGGSNSSAKIFQLYVSPSARGKGIASALLDKLKDHARSHHFQVVTARVASDLPANQFWEKQCFYVIKQEAGGKTSGRTINVRVYELPMSSLLSDSTEAAVTDWLHVPDADPLLPAPTYALDLNVVFDVIHDRADAEMARRLFSAALSGDIRVCVSQEFALELERHSYAPDADPVVKLAKALPTLPSIEQRHLGSLADTLRALVFPERDP
jgi:predicted GNAT family acetyltransferase